jgi:hypothetical protein
MHVMQMTIVEVIDVAMMAHGRVSATRTMLMSMIGMMRLAAGHRFARLSSGFCLGSRILDAARLRECTRHAPCIGGLGHEKQMALARRPGQMGGDQGKAVIDRGGSEHEPDAAVCSLPRT